MPTVVFGPGLGIEGPGGNFAATIRADAATFQETICHCPFYPIMDFGLTKTGAAIKHSFVSGYAGASEAIDEAAICDDIQRLANAIGMANGKQDHFNLGQAENVDYEFVKDAVGKSGNGGRLKTRKQERHLM